MVRILLAPTNIGGLCLFRDLKYVIEPNLSLKFGKHVGIKLGWLKYEKIGEISRKKWKFKKKKT